MAPNNWWDNEEEDKFDNNPAWNPKHLERERWQDWDDAEDDDEDPYADPKPL